MDFEEKQQDSHIWGSSERLKILLILKKLIEAGKMPLGHR